MIKLLKSALTSQARIPTQEGYYSLSDDKLDEVNYDSLCKAPDKDVYVMRKFADVDAEDIFYNQLSPEQRYYRDNGYIILRNFVPHELIDHYLELRDTLDMGRNSFSWDTTPHQTKYPHIAHQSIRDLACYRPLIKQIQHLHSMDMGLIFSLTGMISTERGWHPDSYLDSDSATPRCASWIALGDVDNECGPFEFIPGSNSWPALSNQKINELLNPLYRWPEAHQNSINGAPKWGKLCERFLSSSVDRKVSEVGAKIKKFTASKGDTLIWYGRLVHRGSTPKSKSAFRPALINHYAPIGEKGRGLFVKRKDNSYFLAPPECLNKLANFQDI